jgi:uncharacterized RDD family membrane protein YckC
MGLVSIAAAMPTSTRGTPSARGQTDYVLRVRASGFGRRFVAATIDGLLLASISTVVTFVTAVVLGAPLPRFREIGPDLLVAGILDRNPMAVGTLGLLAGLVILYHLFGVGMAGQTLGMRVVRIRVIASRGRPPGAVRGLVRVLALLVSVLPGGLGWLWAIFDREHRSLHDHIAGTYVILDV